jgi:thiol-disulfide isomerase/thioredoxin
LVVLLVVLAIAGAFGLWRARTDGRLSPKTREKAAFITPGEPFSTFSAVSRADLGPRATLVQFSTAFCQPCRATRKILDEVRVMVDGVTVIHIDAEDNLDLVRALDVRRTPTVFLLDARGEVVNKAVGQPRKADVIAAIGALA